MDNRRVFAFLHDQLTAGLRAVLVTVISVEGSSMRNPGTHMGVCEDGKFVGSLSGGCIESAVVAEAIEALKEGASRVVRFGSGSPYIDIKLPCGGGLDIHFLPLSDNFLVAPCVAAIAARAPFSLRLSLTSNGAEFLVHRKQAACVKAIDTVVISHKPEPKLIILGHGAVVSSLVKLAQQIDVTLEVLTPDVQLMSDLQSEGVKAARLVSPRDTQLMQTDSWTAVVFLFHDHDWEIALMADAIGRPHFYIGAMGGRKAHDFRSLALKKLGCSDAQIAAIYAPIGLFHSSRDPATLALSTLAQLIECYHQYIAFNDRE